MRDGWYVFQQQHSSVRTVFKVETHEWGRWKGQAITYGIGDDNAMILTSRLEQWYPVCWLDIDSMQLGEIT